MKNDKNKKEKINIITFHKIIDHIILQIESILDKYSNSIDIDYETQHHIMNIMFNNKSKIIINRQESLRELWLATINMGYHFQYHKNLWICNRSGKNFWTILSQSCSKQANAVIIF